MLGRLDDVVSRIVNVNHGIMWAAVMFRVSNCVADRARAAIPQPNERQHIGNQIDTAFIFARADFVNEQNEIRNLQGLFWRTGEEV